MKRALDVGQNVCTRLCVLREATFIHLPDTHAYLKLVYRSAGNRRMINKERKSGRPYWFKESTLSGSFLPAVKNYFQGFEKRFIWSSTVSVLTPLYSSLWGA